MMTEFSLLGEKKKNLSL